MSNTCARVPAGRTHSHSRVLLFFSVPWCCVLSLVLATLAVTGSTLGIFFDEWAHRALPILAGGHVYGIVRYLRHPHKTKGQTVFLVVTTFVFVLSLGFHFTDFHDHLLGIND